MPTRSPNVWIWALIIVAAGLFAYRGSFTGVFVLDDDPAIVHNPHITRLWPLTYAMSAPEEATVAARPIVSLTLAINHALAPADVRDVMSIPADATSDERSRFLRNLWGYHAVNLLIHLLAGLTLFGVVRRTMEALSSDRSHQRSAVLAGIAATIWVVHPLQTDSVTYIVQRAESLMGLFYLLTLYCAMRALRSPRPHQYQSQSQSQWVAGAIAACALGMGSKEAMVTAPVLVWIWDRVCLAPGPDASRRPERTILYAGLASTWLVLAWLMLTQPRTHSVGFSFGEWPWWRYLITQAGVITHYLRLAFVPAPLVLDYGWAPASPVDVWPQALLLCALLAATAFGAWKRHPLGLAGAWFFVILAPTSSVVPIATEVAAEHRMYLPLAAVVVTVVAAVALLLRRLGPRVAIAAGVLLAGGAIVVSAEVTNARNQDFVSDETIWHDTVEKRPYNARARNNYAVDLIARGATADAVPQLETATRLDPQFAEARANLGVALCRIGRCSEGIASLERAVSIDPAAMSAHRDLAEAYASQGQMARALDEYSQALTRAPDDVFLLNRAAWILATTVDDRLRNGARAEALSRHAVELTQRHDAISLDTLAAASAELDRFEDAVRIAEEALRLARTQNNDAILPELTTRLALYSERKKSRQ